MITEEEEARPFFGVEEGYLINEGAQIIPIPEDVMGNHLGTEAVAICDVFVSAEGMESRSDDNHDWVCRISQMISERPCTHRSWGDCAYLCTKLCYYNGTCCYGFSESGLAKGR